MAFLFTLHSVSWEEAFLRVLIACAFGFLLGFERGIRQKPLDFRVYMIVAMTACLVAIMGQELHLMYEARDSVELDLTRIIESVLVSIGILGTGAIIKHKGRERVSGSATGGGIWSAGAIGVMLGFGFYGLASMGFIILAIILVFFEFMDKSLSEP